ncbi:TRAP transporter large permease subunit [Candidatus Pelagibacter sp.]|nr:TRAP transporter large permease subunit [Candidatus Pelagibacter sp.]
MEIGSLSLILIVGLLILISIGVPMGFASGFMGAVLVFLYIGEHALGILLSRYYSLVVTYSFLSVPLFIFMASLLERSNIARDLYDALNAWLRKNKRWSRSCNCNHGNNYGCNERNYWRRNSSIRTDCTTSNVEIKI